MAAVTLSSRRQAKRPAAALITALCAAGFVHAQSPQSLLQQNNCYCATRIAKQDGPRLRRCGGEYRGKPDAIEAVAATVRKGAHGGGAWHMPPHPEISRADAMTMARYILSLGDSVRGHVAHPRPWRPCRLGPTDRVTTGRDDAYDFRDRLALRLVAGERISSTGIRVARTTPSASLPSTTRVRPRRPCVPRTIRSAWRFLA